MTPQFPIPPIEDDFSAHRWEGITRPYTAETVKKLRGSLRIEHTLAKLGARKLWKLLQNEEPTRALGAMTGGLQRRGQYAYLRIRIGEAP